MLFEQTGCVRAPCVLRLMADMLPRYGSRCAHYAAISSLRVCLGRGKSQRRSCLRKSFLSAASRRYNYATANSDVTGTIPRGGRGIAVSQYAEICRTFTADDILQYGRLVGDLNPIHIRGHGSMKNESSDEDEDDAHSTLPPHASTSTTAKLTRIRTEDGQPEAVVHGMLVGSLFSSIFGTLIPGSVYRSQTLMFRAPIFADDPIIARVDVIQIKDMKGRGSLVTCSTTVASHVGDDYEKKNCVEGQAEVWLPALD